MLSIYWGDMPEAIYNTSVYFQNQYVDRWITSELSKQMIRDIDHSEVISAHLIESPVLGSIPPTQLSGGVKTLILMAYDNKHIFNASTCGDNCAKWILAIGKEKKLVINLRHLMDFGQEPFKIKVLNTNRIVRNMDELVAEAGQFV